jgi:hypothetical protein
MGRARKSTEELERRGAFDKDPQRRKSRANEPVCRDVIGPPPGDFTHKASPTSQGLLQAWNDLLAAAKEVRLTSADRIVVEATARLLYQTRYRGLDAKTGVYAQLAANLSRLGLTPADRSRVEGTAGSVDAGQVEDANPFEDLETGRGKAAIVH